MPWRVVDCARDGQTSARPKASDASDLALPSANFSQEVFERLDGALAIGGHVGRSLPPSGGVR